MLSMQIKVKIKVGFERIFLRGGKADLIKTNSIWKVFLKIEMASLKAISRKLGQKPVNDLISILQTICDSFFFLHINIHHLGNILTNHTNRLEDGISKLQYQ